MKQNDDNRSRVLLRDRYKSASISTTSHSSRHTGGLHYALNKSSADAQVLAAFDWDQLACRVYSHNFPQTTVKQVDISTISARDLTSYAADLWLMSPSCQPYTTLNSIPGDSSDPRAKSFLHLINNVLPSLFASHALPSRLLIENVAGFKVLSLSTPSTSAKP